MDAETRRVLELHLEEVFEAFYQQLLSDGHFAVFFRDDAHVRDLIERQRENLREALHEGHEAFRERYVRLGRLHHRLMVPYPDFAVGINFLVQQTFRVLGRDGGRRFDSAAVYEFYEAVKAYTAKGYLQCLLEEDDQGLELFAEHVRESREVTSGVVLAQLQQLRQLIYALLNEDPKRLPDFSTANSEFFSWISDPEATEYLALNGSREHLRDVHRRLHYEAENLFYFVHNAHYAEALTLYSKLHKHLLTLNNIITVLFARAKLKELSRDPLTGLLTRHTLQVLLPQRLDLARISGQPFSIVLCDLDDFKGINDQHGHLAGDCVLKETAEILQRYVRSSDAAVRYGGEELLLLLNDTDREGAHQLAEKLRDAVADTVFHCNGEALQITLSLGIATQLPSEVKREERLIDEADRRLYEAKESGKNRVCGGPEELPAPPLSQAR